MKVDLGIAAWSVAGAGADAARPAQRQELSPPGTRRRGGRAALLAVALSQRCLDPAVPMQDAAVLFGTALGCLTETTAFVSHMIAAGEATPKPRAFAASVHNAIASRVALEFGARGECQTFAHGEVAFAHALWAAARVLARARSTAPVLCGAIDEDSGYVRRGLSQCVRPASVIPEPGEGGAVLRLADRAAVRVTDVVWGRPESPQEWVLQHIATPGSIVTVADLRGQHVTGPHLDAARFTTVGGSVHGSLLATACALAAGVLEGSVSPQACGLADRSGRVTLMTRSRLGDCAAITLARTEP
jgi:hypothetical protein